MMREGSRENILIVIYVGIKKYVGLMEKYLEKIKPNIWEACTTDELFYISVDNPTNYD
jgi:hypothetical protein